MSKLTKLGGTRKGAGRPKSPVKTKALGLRVPEEYHQHLADMVRAEIKRLQGTGSPK